MSQFTRQPSFLNQYSTTSYDPTDLASMQEAYDRICLMTRVRLTDSGARNAIAHAVVSVFDPEMDGEELLTAARDLLADGIGEQWKAKAA